VRGRGSDQGGRWPVGLWFALVGMSAGSVTSFALIGWTFTRSLYGGGDAAEPLAFESGTVVIEAEEPVEEAGLDEPAPPGGNSEPDPAPAEPQAEPVADDGPGRSSGEPEAAAEPEEPEEPDAPVEHGEVVDPELVPVEEDDRWCPPDEEAFDWDHDLDWDQWDGAWDGVEGEGPWLRPEFEAPESVEIELPPLD
jgi:hypothetical protein